MRTWDEFLKQSGLDSKPDFQAIRNLARLVNALQRRYIELGLTEKQLAEMTGIKRPCRLFGNNTNPEYKTIATVAHALGMTLELVPSENSFDEKQA